MRRPATTPSRTPAETAALLRKQIDLAIDESLAKGITSFQDAGSPFSTVDALKTMADKHELRMRIWMMLRTSNDQLAPRLDRYRTIGAGGRLLHRPRHQARRSTAPSARAARGSSSPTTTSPTPRGLNTDDPADIRKTAELAIQHGYQLCVHAIGDRANRETLNIFEETFKAHPEKKDLRWRVEHAQHLSAADIPRFGRLGVIAAMQGIHCTSDAPYVLLRLGAKRAEEGAYVWQKLMKSGAVVANGTDAPVEDVSPLASFYATVSRKLKDGTVFYPDQRMSREEALKSYTLNNAYAAFEENLQGRPRARQARRRRRPLPRHHDHPRGRHPLHRRRLHDRRRQGPVRQDGGLEALVEEVRQIAPPMNDVDDLHAGRQYPIEDQVLKDGEAGGNLASRPHALVRRPDSWQER